MNLIAWSIPVFVALIVLEFVLAQRQRRDLYRLSVAASDMACGVQQQLFGVVSAAGLAAVYVLFYQWRLLELDPSAASTWAIGMLAVDFSYYWWHRASHECNLLWAAHVVHHHSEDFNLAVALRQSTFTALTLLLFGLPLALLGVPPLVYFVSKALNSLYQFWIHTELIGDLGKLEGVLNTPRHHQVHHAVNPRYLDKNYGGILIIFDRIFGSFTRLDEAPVYGTTKRLRSLNPLWAQFEYFGEIAARVREGRSVRERLRAIFAHPSWRAGRPPEPDLGASELAERRGARFFAPVSKAMSIYVLAQGAAIVAATMMVLLAARAWPGWLAWLACATVTAGAVALVGLMERRPWALPLEVARLAATAAVIGLIAARG